MEMSVFLLLQMALCAYCVRAYTKVGLCVCVCLWICFEKSRRYAYIITRPLCQIDKCAGWRVRNGIYCIGVINVWRMWHLKEINGVGDIELIFALINQAKSLAMHFKCVEWTCWITGRRTTQCQTLRNECHDSIVALCSSLLMSL